MFKPKAIGLELRFCLLEYPRKKKPDDLDKAPIERYESVLVRYFHYGIIPIMNELCVFVTGSTGLLGLNTVDALLAKGYRVKALARSAEKARRVLPHNERVEIVVGDLSDPTAWFEHLSNCDALVHAAAYFREYFGRGEHDAQLKKLNVDLPVALAKEAQKRGVTRQIFVSSTGVLSGRADGAPSAEADPSNVQIPGNGYQESKKQMEVALAALNIPMVIVRPGWMWGPKDYAPTATTQIVLDMMKTKTFQFVLGTPFGIVDARDVATGISELIELPDPKPIYHLAGNNISAMDAIETVARELGTVKVQRIPMGMALMMSSILEVVTKVFGKRNPLPREGILVISKGVLVSSDLAKQDLKVLFRPFSDSARDTVTFARTAFQGEGVAWR